MADLTSSPEELCAKARKLWLEDPHQLSEVEAMYRAALMATKTVRQGNKMRRVQALSKPDYRAAGEKMALILCQSGRSNRALDGLKAVGYNCRLADCVLNYPTSAQDDVLPISTRNEEEDPPCVMFDNFVSSSVLSKLQQIFLSPKARYWRDHNYKVEPPSPYFSYIYRLHKHSMKTLLGGLARKIQNRCQEAFPEIRSAKYVELWAHCRPHATGHQLHFDSDNEGRGGVVHNPICSTILFLTDGCGGPSLITNQRLSDQRLATKGWLAHPAERRLVAFDGSVLHGVIPGKTAPCSSSTRRYVNKHRVTLMMAFWREIRVRDDERGRYGAARSLPAAPKWSQALLEPVSRGYLARHGDSGQVQPIALPHVYEDLDGQQWPENQNLPDYNSVFQGF